MKRLLRGTALIERANKLGVSDHDAWTTAGINEAEMQRRVREAEGSLRAEKLWKVALISAIASVVSALAALCAVAFR